MQLDKDDRQYAALVDALQAGSLGESAFLHPENELEIQSLWFAGQFGRNFVTIEGREVRILDFGAWNRCAGPDFLRVSAEIDGQVFEGDLEIDTYPENWESHGHATNPGYNDVILHICLQPTHAGEWFTRTSDHRKVDQILLSAELQNQAFDRPAFSESPAHLGRCSTPLAGFPRDALDSLFRAAARRRLRAKGARYRRSEEAHGSDQALFIALAESLGYRPNQFALKSFSQRLGLRQLRELGEAAEGVIFGAAGFLSPDIYDKAPPESRDYLRGLWNDWWKYRSEFSVEPSRLPPWKLVGQRPVNHLHRRLGALAAVLGKWDAFRSACRRAVSEAAALLDFFADLEHGHWNRHYTLTSQASAKPMALVGRSRAMDFLVNHLIPRAAADRRDVWQHYAKLKASSPNDRVKRAMIRLLGQREDAASFARYHWQQQGLLQIYRDFCLNDATECIDCPFPEQLRQWHSRHL